jgi:hypothetical protein
MSHQPCGEPVRPSSHLGERCHVLSPTTRKRGESIVKNLAIGVVLLLGGCGSLPLIRGPQVSKSTCTASCNAHFEQCPQVFAAFPERGAVECPAEHDNCLRSCETRALAARTVAAPQGLPPTDVPVITTAPSSSPRLMPSTVGAVSSKEAKLRELKHLYDEGLVTDDVYKDRQRAILSEP